MLRAMPAGKAIARLPVSRVIPPMPEIRAGPARARVYPARVFGTIHPEKITAEGKGT